MGTRKRAGKGRHDKKGKGKKHHKKQQAHYDDWDPASSGQESDTPSEPERSDTPRLSKQGRQHSGHESDNEKVTDTSKVTGGHRWMPVFLVVFVVVVLSVTPFLLQHYKQTDSGFMSFLNPFASKQQSADFSQSETNVEYSFTEKDESVGRDNEASCLRDCKETKQEIHTADADNNTDTKLQTLSDSDEADLDRSSDTEDVNRDEIEQNTRSVDLEEDSILESRSSIQDGEPSLPTDSSRIDTKQAVDEGEQNHDEKILHVERTQISNTDEASKPKDAEVVSKDEQFPSDKMVLTESTGESVQSGDTSKAEPAQIKGSEKEESQETTEQSAESEREQSLDAVEQLAKSAREETLEGVAKTSESTREQSQETAEQPAESTREKSQETAEQSAESTREESQETPEQPAESTREESQETAEQLAESTREQSHETAEQSAESKREKSQETPEQPAESTREESQETAKQLAESTSKQSQETAEQPAESTREESQEAPEQPAESTREESSEVEPVQAAEQTDTVTSEQKTPAILTNSKHVGDGKFRDNIDTITVEDSKQATASPPKPKKIYVKANITNSDDNKIRQDLDNADELQEKNRVLQAQAKYRAVLARHPNSPRANYGLAQTLCKQAEEQLSNKLLEECIEQYQKVLSLPDVPRVLMLKAGRTCAERQQFRGWGHRAVKVYKKLLDAYPDELELWNELGVQYLMIGRNNEAKAAFTQLLHHKPNDPFAKAHMGFIYKTSDNNLEKAVPMLLDALSSNDPSVLDGRFYFHLGDALQRVGNKTEAYKWYEKGEELGLFRSKFQRSLYNVEHLTARPWWTKEQTGQQQLIQMLEDNWKTIRDEGVANIDKSGLFLPENENLRETGDWKQLTLFQQGRKNVENCKKAPKTCALIERFPAAATCKRGQVKYSIMQPGVHVWPHCGPTNCRIRMHLGLVVPKDCCRIRVVDDTRTWEEGKVIVFDDSFEHEVWHDGSKFRLVLIVDIWHPELTSRHKASLSPI